MGNIATTTMTVEQKTFYSRVLQERLLDETFLYKLGKKGKLPKKNGKEMTWRKFLPLALPNAPLTEGVAPKGNKLTIVDYKVATKQYGDFVTMSDLFDITSMDDVTSETAQLLGEQAGKFCELLIANELKKSLNVYYADSTSTPNSSVNDIAVGDTISVAHINRVKAILKRYNAKSINGKYIWLISPEMEMDLKNATSSNAAWIDVAKYANSKDIIDGEIGEFLGFRFVVTNLLPVDNNTNSVGVTSSFVLGKDAFGVIELEDSNFGNVEIIHNPLGSQGNDELHQKQSLGWKINGFGAYVLNDEALLVFKCAPSATVADALVESSRANYNGSSTSTELKATLTFGAIKAADGTTIASPTITVKQNDSTGTAVSAETDGSYKLGAGTYWYSVAKASYVTKYNSVTIKNSDLGENIKINEALAASQG